MTLVRIILVAILVGSGTYWYLDRLKMGRDYEKGQRNARALLDQAKARGEVIDLVSQSPNPLDKGTMGFPSGYKPSPSPWESAEKARGRALFPAGGFDVLVIPYQVNGFALDRSTRSLMFAQLSIALRDAECQPLSVVC